MTESDLKRMRIKDLRRFNMDPAMFHKVKHTIAFRVLIDRLEDMEKKYFKIKEAWRVTEDNQWFLRPTEEEAGITWKDECIEVKERLSKYENGEETTERNQ